MFLEYVVAVDDQQCTGCAQKQRGIREGSRGTNGITEIGNRVS
jgi:hypothetical protein